MSSVALVLVAAGVALLLVGVGRVRRAWPQYAALRDQEANIARYEAWRGGRREEGPTGASVAMAYLLRRAQVGGGLVIAGAGCLVVALFVR